MIEGKNKKQKRIRVYAMDEMILFKRPIGFFFFGRTGKWG
jgi:hypothetical protein